MEGEAKKNIVAATNGKSFPTGFYTWDDKSTKYCVAKPGLGKNSVR